jgi:hypothetical protein
MGGIVARTIELLQIGDVHFDSADEKKGVSDVKDRGFAEKLTEPMRISEINYIIQELMKESWENIRAILMCGDLTTFGNMDGYKRCLEFFSQRLLKFCSKFGKESILIVPGNHDIIRENFSEKSFFPKFMPIIKALNDGNFSEFPILILKKCELEDELLNKVIVVMINSCIGCGERRYYPKEISKVIPKAVSKSSIEDFEKLDTPIFYHKCIEDITNDIYLKNDKCMPIILTHHNLLTMRKNRIAVYTELLNGGGMRECLLSLGKPVLYLHGHIHDNPIEIIQSPQYSDAKVICVSAPLLFPNSMYKDNKFGYNRIKIMFNQNNIPIGCEIIQHEFYNGIHNKHLWKIRFWMPPRTNALVSQKGKELLGLIDDEKYLTDIWQNYKKDNKAEFTEREMIELIEELDWLGLVEYKECKPPLTGSVRKVVR